MIDKISNMLGTKFIGFILSGLGLLVALWAGKLDGATFGENLVWLFAIFAGGNAVATSAGALKDAMVARKDGAGES